MVDRKLLTLSLVTVAVAIGCGTVFVVTGLVSRYKGSRDLSIFGGCAIAGTPGRPENRD